MAHTLYSILLISLLFGGCADKEYIYVKAECPKIKQLEPVEKIELQVKDGCVCNDDLGRLINGARQLRKSETYYHDEVGRYNEEFTDF